MPEMKLGDMLRGKIYAFVYGREGVGKTNLIMSIAKKKDGTDVAIITPESSGPTSILSRGYSSDMKVYLLPPDGEDPFEPCIQAISKYTKDPSISAICVDGLSVLCGRGISYLSDGAGEKALGYEGWGLLLNSFRAIEAACEKASRAGKSIVLTAWENPAKTEPAAFGGGSVIVEPGRPLLQGKAQTWMPGNCDIVARMSSKWVKEKGPDGKPTKTFKAQLQVNASEDWMAKTRWKLPDPCPADLGWILKHVEEQSRGKKASPTPLKKVVAK